MAAATTWCRVAVGAAVDPLKFRDQKRYIDRLKESRAKTGYEDAVLVATGKLYERDITVAVQDFDFMGGSLGMAAGQGDHHRARNRGRHARPRSCCSSPRAARACRKACSA